jgi:hypothetical protein
VINVITKSGTNEWKGLLGFYAEPGALEAERKQPNEGYQGALATETVDRSQYDITGDISGPLMKDKLFFYGAFNPTFTLLDRQAPECLTGRLVGTANCNRPGLRDLGEQTQERTLLNYAGKLNWIPTSNHTFEVSAFGEESGFNEGGNRSLARNDNVTFSSLDFGSLNVSARYDGIFSSNFFGQAKIALAQNDFTEEFLFGDRFQYSDRRTANFVTRGGPGFFENNESENLQISARGTYLFDAGGSHEVNIGYNYEDVDWTAIRRYTGPDVPINIEGFGDVTLFGVSARLYTESQRGIDADGDPTTDLPIFQFIRGNFNDPNLTTSTKYHSFYLQDQWEVTDWLTLKPGVRYDYQSLNGAGPDAISVDFSGNWAPRIGAIIDPTRDGRTKIFANYGRFFEKIPLDIAVRSLSVEQGVTSVYYTAIPNGSDFDIGTQITAPEDVVLSGAHPTVIVDGTESQYSDELVLGAEREVFTNFSLGARFIHRNLGRVLEDVSGATVTAYLLGIASSTDYVITNPDGDTDIFNEDGTLACSDPVHGTGCTGDGAADGFADPKRNYNAVELTAEKRYSNNWTVLANYRWARLEGVYEGLFRNDNGQSDPNITSLYDFPVDKYLGFQFDEGLLNTDRTHVFNVNGSRKFGALNLGVGFRATSGTPITSLGHHPIYGNGGEIPIFERGDADGDGEVDRTDWNTDLNLNVSYPIEFGSARLTLQGDVFNVFNTREEITVDEFATLDVHPLFVGDPAPGGGTVTENDVLNNLTLADFYGDLSEDFGKPLTYDRPLYVRLAAKIEF